MPGGTPATILHALKSLVSWESALIAVHSVISLTFVPQPRRKPTPKVAAAEPNERGGAGYVGIRDGASRYTGITLDIKPATMGTFSWFGLKTHPDTRDEMPKIAPLWKSRPEEP